MKSATANLQDINSCFKSYLSEETKGEVTLQIIVIIITIFHLLPISFNIPTFSVFFECVSLT